MIDIQSAFYGVCGLLAAIAISQPRFYIEYAFHLLVAAYFNIVLILAITLVSLKVANDIPEYKNELNDFARYFSEFLLSIDNAHTVSFMVLLFIVWLNLFVLCTLLKLYGDRSGRL